MGGRWSRGLVLSMRRVAGGARRLPAWRHVAAAPSRTRARMESARTRVDGGALLCTEVVVRREAQEARSRFRPSPVVSRRARKVVWPTPRMAAGGLLAWLANALCPMPLSAGRAKLPISPPRPRQRACHPQARPAPSLTHAPGAAVPRPRRCARSAAFSALPSCVSRPFAILAAAALLSSARRPRGSQPRSDTAGQHRQPQRRAKP